MDFRPTTRGRSGLELAGLGLVYVPFIALYAFEIARFNDWWGGWGVALALLAPPIVPLFPFIYWLMDEFSLLYFGLLALIGVGTGILGALDRDETRVQA